VDQFQTVSSYDVCLLFQVKVNINIILTCEPLQTSIVSPFVRLYFSVGNFNCSSLSLYDRCVTDTLFECIERKCIIERNPENWGVLGPHPLWMGVQLTIEKQVTCPYLLPCQIW